MRRLVHDGVDSPLASLFVDVAVGPKPPLIPLLSKVGNPQTPFLGKEGNPRTPLLVKEGCPKGGEVPSPPNADGRAQLLDSSTLDFSTRLNAEGADRARSASEAFLYRRLETLAATAGRFRLNAELPIPFDGWGRMEVDLLCAESKIAIELDGGPHLGDPDAYRRDRRKDALLQENGYLVLRFLAEDVGKYLDQVLEAILRALSHQDGKV